MKISFQIEQDLGVHVLDFSSDIEEPIDKYRCYFKLTASLKGKYSFETKTSFYREEIERFIYALKLNETEHLKGFDLLSCDKDFLLRLQYDAKDVLRLILTCESELYGYDFSIYGTSNIDLFDLRRQLEEVLSIN